MNRERCAKAECRKKTTPSFPKLTLAGAQALERRLQAQRVLAGLHDEGQAGVDGLLGLFLSKGNGWVERWRGEKRIGDGRRGGRCFLIWGAHARSGSPRERGRAQGRGARGAVRGGAGRAFHEEARSRGRAAALRSQALSARLLPVAAQRNASEAASRQWQSQDCPRPWAGGWRLPRPPSRRRRRQREGSALSLAAAAGLSLSFLTVFLVAAVGAMVNWCWLSPSQLAVWTYEGCGR